MIDNLIFQTDLASAKDENPGCKVEFIDGEFIVFEPSLPANSKIINRLVEQISLCRSSKDVDTNLTESDLQLHLGRDWIYSGFYGSDLFCPEILGLQSKHPDEIEMPVSIVPDWVREVLSPAATETELTKKLDKYGPYGVDYYWIIDTGRKTVRVYVNMCGRFHLLSLATHNESDVDLPPFENHSINLDKLWG